MTTYDILTKTKNTVRLSIPISKFVDSIAFHRSIYAMGNDSYSGQVYEFNIKLQNIKQKANMLKGKMNHSLCIAIGHIYSIGGV